MSVYPAETWMLKKFSIEKLNSFEMQCWRRLLRIAKTTKRTNNSIREEIDATHVLQEKFRFRIPKYFGHITRNESGLEGLRSIKMKTERLR